MSPQPRPVPGGLCRRQVGPFRSPTWAHLGSPITTQDSPHLPGAACRAPAYRDVYREVIPDRVPSGKHPPDDAVSGATKTSMDYDSRLVVAVYRVGKGRLVLSAPRILENLGHHPVAGKLPVDLLRWAASE